MKSKKKSSICYLDPKNKKYYVCDTKGRYSCKLLQKYYNMALESGNRIVVEAAIQLKKELNCRWAKSEKVGRSFSPKLQLLGRRNPESIKAYKFSEFKKKQMPTDYRIPFSDYETMNDAIKILGEKMVFHINTGSKREGRYMIFYLGFASMNDKRKAERILASYGMHGTQNRNPSGRYGKGTRRNPNFSNKERIRRHRSLYGEHPNFPRRRIHRVNPETMGDIWQLESDEGEVYSDILSNISQRAIDGDRKEQRFLMGIWDESWSSIKKKLETEGSAWYVWWTDGVREFMRREHTRRQV